MLIPFFLFLFMSIKNRFFKIRKKFLKKNMKEELHHKKQGKLRSLEKFLGKYLKL